MTLVVAVLGLVIGLAGVALSALALGRSDEATTLAQAAHDRPAPAPAAAQPAIAAPTAAPATDPTTGPATDPAGQTDPGVSATPEPISPSAQFNVFYEEEKLRIRSHSCDYTNNTYVDLDEPRVIGEAVESTELGYAQCEPGKISIDLPFAQVAGPGATPADCLETIRTNPGRSPVAPVRGMTLCLVTSQDQAAERGIPQKLVFITVDSISLDNSASVLGVTAKAWTVPK